MTCPDSQETADDPPFVLDVLVDMYVELRATWRAALLDRDAAPDAPWEQWRTGLDGDAITTRDVMMQYGELSGVNAAKAVTQHLGLLARAYWLDPANPDNERGRWLHAAPYAPARAVLESAAMTGWLLAPGPDPDERARRGAVLALWSRPKKWEAALREAGFDVAVDERGVRFVRTGADSRPLSIHAMIKAVHGRAGTEFYSRWSKLVHNDPEATSRNATMRPDVEGIGWMSVGVIREDEHVVLVADIARLLVDAGEQQAAYFGRTAAPLVATCTRIVETINEQLPGLVAAVEARHAREQTE